MGSSPLRALLLPFSVAIAAVIFVATGSLVFALLAFVCDAVPIGFLYMTALKAERERDSAVQQDRLTRYSGGDR